MTIIWNIISSDQTQQVCTPHTTEYWRLSEQADCRPDPALFVTININLQTVVTTMNHRLHYEVIIYDSLHVVIGILYFLKIEFFRKID